MAENQPGLVAVQSGLVRQTLVEAVFTRVEKRRGEKPVDAIAAVLNSEEHSFADDEPALDRGLRLDGYLTRVIEPELFEPAQAPAEWPPDLVRERFARTASWSPAWAGACSDLARAEPLDKPRPDDETAMSWRVPGPGGHVRHYLALHAIEDRLQWRKSPVEDPAALKRPWLYGFFVRTCEEALPPEATLDLEE